MGTSHQYFQIWIVSLTVLEKWRKAVGLLMYVTVPQGSRQVCRENLRGWTSDGSCPSGRSSANSTDVHDSGRRWSDSESLWVPRMIKIKPEKTAHCKRTSENEVQRRQHRISRHKVKTQNRWKCRRPESVSTSQTQHKRELWSHVVGWEAIPISHRKQNKMEFKFHKKMLRRKKK